MKFAWGNEPNKAFGIIKVAVTSKPLLAIHDHDAETKVHTDACTLGLGAALLQKQPDGKWHPVSFYSRRAKSRPKTPAEPLKNTQNDESHQFSIVYRRTTRLI